jgi:DNA-binding transcriptional regulator YiaG
MKEVRRRWGANIKAGRSVLGLSQQDLARLVGTTQQSVCRWEAGDAAPRDHFKVRVAEALHQDVVQLFPLFRSVNAA